MKKYYYLILILFASSLVYAQRDGIMYQAVIIDNNPQEIPGVDIPSNNLPDKDLRIRFSIIDVSGNLEYQETQDTTTDPYGMIHVMIGDGLVTSQSLGAFNEIYWSDNKQLQVEIDLFDGNGFVAFSSQELTYLPYVKHREIVATSTLDVDGATNLNNTLEVDGATNLNNTLEVDGAVQLNNSLLVEGQTDIQSDLNVNNGSTTTLSGDLYVQGTAFFTDGVFDNLTVNEDTQLNTLSTSGATNINNTLSVNNNSQTTLTGDLQVDGVSLLKNYVRVDLENEVATSENQFTSYPFQVQGGSQGIAIKLNENEPDRSNNYISFWSSNNIARGRIEGNNYLEPISRDFVFDLIDPPGLDDVLDIVSDPGEDAELPEVFQNQYYDNDYTFSAYHYTQDFAFSIIRLGINIAGAISVPCIAGDCDDVAWSFVDFALDGIQLAEHFLYNSISIGVAFESGSADYAEWLRKDDDKEFMSFGEIVGVKGGVISKTFNDAETFMVVSQNPLMSGAMPADDEKHLFEKIAFMGQVPVKVIGKVSKGDYILPSGQGDGFAVAVTPEAMKINDYKRIVGVAWQDSDGIKPFTYINTAIGLNKNDMVNVIDQMQQVINNLQRSMASLDENYTPVYFENSGITQVQGTTTANIKNEIFDWKSMKNKSLENLVAETKTILESSEFEFDRFPYLMEMLDNPTKENADKVVDHYTKVLSLMQKRNLIQSNR
ncbi:MAG: hypothetical protein ACWA5P_07415 [bacterium]